MYPYVSDLIAAVTGINVNLSWQTFHFFFCIGILVSFCILFFELKRKESRNLIYGCYDAAGHYIKPHNQTLKIILLTAISGLFGAKALAIIENPRPFVEAPLYVIFSGSNFVFHGGFVLAVITLIIYARRINLKFFQLMDALAPSAMLGYAVGRLGCYLSGVGVCGMQNPGSKPPILNFVPEWLWTYGEPSFHTVFPTQLYEAFICGILFCLLWSIRRSVAKPGIIFSLYLFFYGTERFLIEQLRIKDDYELLGFFTLKQPQLIAMLLVFAGCLLYYVCYTMEKRKLFYYGDYLRGG
jgi:phosphatidylglycerol:prolipoprotein diacylglycerol transferase